MENLFCYHHLPVRSYQIMTPSKAKNAIIKALLEIIDPPPTKIQKKNLRSFFENKCAFCGTYIDPDGRKEHIDHLIPSSQGGSNHISNRVLACSICNGDEKLDQNWEKFLENKVLDLKIFQERRVRIIEWVKMNNGPKYIDPFKIETVKSVTENVNKVFMATCDQLKQIRG